MKLTFGNPGFGTVPHLTMAGMDLETGLKVSHVPFAGENKEIAALLGGHLMAAGIAIESCIAQVQAGQLRAIAVLQGDRRLSAFPDIPTLKEVAQGLRDEIERHLPWPDDVGPRVAGPRVKKLAAAFDAGRKSPTFQKFAKEKYIFQDGMPLVGQALHDHLDSGYKDTGELLQKLGIQKK
jgi:tripartite-type tricarboxylate transporter receptor subunit TctC